MGRGGAVGEHDLGVPDDPTSRWVLHLADKIGSGKRGPITEKIQEKFFSAVYGREPAYSTWLHRVPTGVAQVGLAEPG